MSSDVVLFGPPGCGKGTQAKRLTNFHHISTGDLFREAVASGNELGRKIQPLLGKGLLIPDEITLQMVADECLSARRIVWDGFPRTVPQVEAFDPLLERHGRKIGVVINLDVPEQVLLERVVARFEVSRRDDDNPEAFARRLETYHKQTAPVLRCYEGRVVTLDGTLPPDQVAEKIAKLIPC